MLRAIGIESRLQLVITGCIVALIVVTTVGSSGPPWVFFTYRTLLVFIAITTAISSWRTEFSISRTFLVGIAFAFMLMLISAFRIPGSHFEAFYLWFKYAFFAAAFVNLAKYARYQSARWRGFLIATIAAVGIAYLLPDLALHPGQVMGFSTNNANYF